MVSIDLGDGFRTVPQNAVCLNGMALSQINTETEPYAGRWCLVAPNGYAVDNEFCRPYVYKDLDEAREDKANLLKMEDYSTCGGPITPTQDKIDLDKFNAAKAKLTNEEQKLLGIS